MVQTACESAGLTTVSISLLREVTEILRPPRALFVPFPFGYPLGEPHNAPLQHSIVGQALDLLTRDDVPFIAGYKS